MSFDVITTKLSNLLSLLRDFLVWPRLRGLKHSLVAHYLILYVEGLYGIQVTNLKLKVGLLLVAPVIFYRGAGGEVDDMAEEILSWWSCDWPTSRPVISLGIVARFLAYYVSFLCGVLSPGLFWDAVLFLFFPLLWPTVFWGSFYLVSGESTMDLPGRLIRWIRADPTSSVPAYGFGLYALALRGDDSLPLHIYFTLCVIWSTTWQWMAVQDQRKLWHHMALPLRAVYFGLMLIYTLTYHFRLFAMLRVWSVKYRGRRWFRQLTRRDPRAENAGVYQYAPLSPGEIRLLGIQRTLGGALVCDIYHVRLCDVHDGYEAISYTWGSSQREKRVLVLGKWLAVTQHAYDILYDRAPWTGWRFLWMDSVCINQDDNKEKGIQVPMMGEIYRQAARVVVWLGPSPDGEAAFSLIRELNQRLWLLSAAGTPSMSAIEMTRAKGFDALNALDGRFRALGRLLLHNYFVRVWIIQEIFFGKAVHIWCDGLWLDWDVFARPLMVTDGVLTMLVGERYLFEACRGNLRGLVQIRKVYAMRRLRLLGECEPGSGFDSRPLAAVLRGIGAAKATNPRDFVYGYLNLSSDVSVPEFTPDYDTGTADIYVRFATLFLQRGELDGTLYQAGVGYARNLQTLPSWVVDWSCFPGTQPFDLGIYDASKGTAFNAAPRYQQQIGVRGVYVDRIISMTTSPFSIDMTEVFRRGDRKITVSCVDKFFSNAEQLVSCLPQTYPTGQPRHDAFWRTLIGDVMDDRSLDFEQDIKSRWIPPYSRHNFVRPATNNYRLSYERLRENFRSNQSDDGSNTEENGVPGFLNTHIFGKTKISSLPTLAQGSMAKQRPDRNNTRRAEQPICGNDQFVLRRPQICHHRERLYGTGAATHRGGRQSHHNSWDGGAICSPRIRRLWCV